MVIALLFLPLLCSNYLGSGRTCRSPSPPPWPPTPMTSAARRESVRLYHVCYGMPLPQLYHAPMLLQLLKHGLQEEAAGASEPQGEHLSRLHDVEDMCCTLKADHLCAGGQPAHQQRAEHDQRARIRAVHALVREQPHRSGLSLASARAHQGSTCAGGGTCMPRAGSPPCSRLGPHFLWKGACTWGLVVLGQSNMAAPPAPTVMPIRNKAVPPCTRQRAPHQRAHPAARAALAAYQLCSVVQVECDPVNTPAQSTSAPACTCAPSSCRRWGRSFGSHLLKLCLQSDADKPLTAAHAHKQVHADVGTLFR